MIAIGQWQEDPITLYPEDTAAAAKKTVFGGGAVLEEVAKMTSGPPAPKRKAWIGQPGQVQAGALITARDDTVLYTWTFFPLRRGINGGYAREEP